jgi:hypothetical protein
VRRHAKASSAGSTKGHGKRLALLFAMAAVFLLVPAAQALADVTVLLEGTGKGTVTSTAAGLECSNVPGAEKESAADCIHQFPFGIENVELTATPAPSSVFGGWAIEGNLDGNCAGLTNPCKFTDGGEFGLPPVTVKAIFEPPPPAPTVTTGETGEVNYYYASLEGQVDPEGNSVNSCRFEFGPTTAYGESSPCSPASLGSGTAPVAVSGRTSELQPSTTYHYRLVATNAGGAGEGEDRTFTTTAAPADNCPNAAVRAEQGIRALRLPACMAYEQVSPEKKYGSFAFGALPSGSGDRVYFESGAALGETPGLATLSAGYVATRGSSGWTTKATSPPKEYCCGSGAGAGEPLAFSPDLSHWSSAISTAPQSQRGVSQVFVDGFDGSHLPLSPRLSPYEGRTLNEPVLQGASTDLSRTFFYPGQTSQGGGGSEGTSFFPGDPVPTGQTVGENIYEAHLDASGQPAADLLQRDASGKVWGGRCGAQIGLVGGNTFGPEVQQGAVSDDGSRVFFATRAAQPAGTPCSKSNKVRILRRLQTPSGPQVSEPTVSECTRVAPACDGTDGDDSYAGASLDGRKLFFATTRQLANTDLDAGTECKLAQSGTSPGCDLYVYDYSRPAGQRLTQVSAGDASAPERGKNAEVLGVTAISGDGSHAYFVARGVLTTAPGATGKTAVLGKPNLYLYERDAAHPGGRTLFIATLQDACVNSEFDCNGWNGTLEDNARAVPLVGGDPSDYSKGGNGHLLFFLTNMPLLGADLDGEQRDVYRYDADSGSLALISQGELGAESNGPFSVLLGGAYPTSPMGSNFAQAGRWVDETGNTLAFGTAEALVPSDNDDQRDFYLWRDGQLTRLPQAQEATVSQAGNEVSIATYATLTGLDRDTARDVYVARVNGGFPTPIEPAPCVESACQGPVAGLPAGTAATGAFVGAGNVKEKPKKHGHKKKKKQRKHKRHAAHRKGARR